MVGSYREEPDMTPTPLLSWLFWWFVAYPIAGFALGVAVVAIAWLLSPRLTTR